MNRPPLPLPLPPHLACIRRVVVDPDVADAPLVRRVRERLPDVPWEVSAPGLRTLPEFPASISSDHPDRPDNPDNPARLANLGHSATSANSASPASPEFAGEPRVLYLKRYRGKFLRFCPGTRHYRCCAYRIIHIGENCPLRCSYCILNAYFQDKTLKVWANQDELFAELAQAFGRDPKARFRVGTGEFTDSLALEAVTGYSRDIVGFLAGYGNVCLELKSKVVDLSWMDKARPDRVLPAWSLNAPAIALAEEGGSSGRPASLEERLSAAKTCAGAGFRVCLHFDPIIHYPGWESDVDGYGAIADMIFDYLRPKDIAYLSLGSFRFMPELKEAMQRDFPASRYIYNEFVAGIDGKQRLLRPLRVAQFRFLASRLQRHGLTEQLYFCMESDEVWRAVFGYTPKEFGGLGRHLLGRAFGE